MPDGRAVEFAYDAKGNLTSLTPPGQASHLFDYTAVDQTKNYTPPTVDTTDPATHYSYNRDKQLELITRPDGQTLDWIYDSAGRLQTLSAPHGDIAYSYDSAGRLQSLTAPDNVVLSYGYDGSLLTGVALTGPVSGSLSRSYDNDFRVSSLSVNGADPFSYHYDNDSLLTAVGNATLGINLTLTRDARNGLLTGTALGSLTDSTSYNGFGEVSQYLATFGTADLYKTDLSRDKLGRISRKIETVGGIANTFDYAYDVAGHLVEVKQNGIVQSSYGYDTNGNRTDLNGVVIAHYDAQDRLLDYNSAGYDYTTNGELKTKTVGTATTGYSYDVLGNLRHVILPNGTAIDYLIDGQNRRIGKKRNNVLEQGFLYQDQLKPIAELDGNNNIVSRFVYATGANVPDFMIKGGVTYRLIKDHLGSPRLVVDVATNTVIQQLNYDVWGKVIQDSNPGFQPFGYAGGLYDRDTHLVRFGARDYDAETGRWTAKDPIGFEGGDTNLYGYVVNDPVNLIDSFGLAPGDSYESPGDAAQGVATDIMNMGPQRIEWGGWIYQQPDGSFSYTKPRTDNEETHVSPGSPLACPGEPFADYHSHWAKKGYKYNIFSNDDKRSNFFNHIPGYLIKPNGGVNVYVPPPYWDVPSKYSPSMGYTGSVK